MDRLKGKQLRIRLKVLGIRGLPSNMCEDVYVSFRFFLDDQPKSTPKENKKTINPKFNYETAWNVVVTDELCSYLASDVLEFVVYAKTNANTAASAAADPTAPVTAAGSGGGVKNGPSEPSIDEDTLQQLQEKEDELQELKFQLSEQKLAMERKMREALASNQPAASAAESKTDGAPPTHPPTHQPTLAAAAVVVVVVVVAVLHAPAPTHATRAPSHVRL